MVILPLLIACAAEVPVPGNGVDSGGGETGDYPWPCEATELAYEDIAPEWGLFDTTDAEEFPNTGGGVTVADLDEDGLDDVVIAVRTGTTVIHWNRGDHFEQQVLALDFPGNAVAAIDVDGDRHLDLLISGTNPSFFAPTFVRLLGDGAGGFTAPEELRSPGNDILSIDAADYDRDGDVDLYVTTSGPDELFRNDGAGRFESVDDVGLGLHDWTWRSWIGMWVDGNKDGWPDLLVANDQQTEFGATRAYTNENGSFVAATAPTTVNAMGGSVIDYNNDGWPDVYITGTGPDGLYANTASGGWYDAAAASGAIGNNDLGRMHLGSAAFDADNDGWTDLVAVGGRIGIDDALLALQDVVEPDNLLLNRQGVFKQSASKAQLGDDRDGKAVAVGDLDGDGTPEVVITQLGAPSHVYRSECMANRSIDVELAGKGANAYALGARVEAHTSAGDFATWVGTLQGLLGNGPPRAHIGLGTAELQGLTVYWPDGTISETEQSAPGRVLIREE